MIFKEYLKKLEQDQPLFKDQEMENRRGLYGTLLDTKETLDTLGEMLHEEVVRLISKIDNAIASASPQTPFYETVLKTKEYIVELNKRMTSDVEKLTWKVEQNLAMQGTNLSKKNLMPQDKSLSSEDLERASRIHGSNFSDIPPDARRM